MNIIGILDHCDRNVPVKRARDGAGQHDAATWIVAMKMPSGWQPSKFFRTRDDAIVEAQRLAAQGIETRVGDSRSSKVVWQSR